MSSRRTRGIVLAATLGLAGLGASAALNPAVADAVTTGTQAVSTRVTAIRGALSGLVKDGTLTQAQAHKVATTLDKTLPQRGMRGGFGPGGFGPGGFGRDGDLTTAAGVIGVTTDQLRTALEGGKTLAQVAQSKGVSQATLVDKLVAAARTRIAAAVTAKQLTQAQADAMSTDLKARITAQVTHIRPAGGRGHGGGWGRPGAPGGPAGSGGESAPSSPGGSPSSGTSTS